MKPELKEKHLKEIKSLESEYNRNLTKIIEIQELQGDIISRIQIISNKFK